MHMFLVQHIHCDLIGIIFLIGKSSPFMALIQVSELLLFTQICSSCTKCWKDNDWSCKVGSWNQPSGFDSVGTWTGTMPEPVWMIWIHHESLPTIYRLITIILFQFSQAPKYNRQEKKTPDKLNRWPGPPRRHCHRPGQPEIFQHEIPWCLVIFFCFNKPSGND